GQLSKGYRQRVGLAQAMIDNPELLIPDERTTGLDPNQIVEIRQPLPELGEEKTLSLSTHIVPEVEATCDRLQIIHKGTTVADGTADTLRKQASGGELIHVKIEDADPSSVINTVRKLPTVYQATILDEKSGHFELESKVGTSSKRDIF